MNFCHSSGWKIACLQILRYVENRKMWVDVCTSAVLPLLGMSKLFIGVGLNHIKWWWGNKMPGGNQLRTVFCLLSNCMHNRHSVGGLVGLFAMQFGWYILLLAFALAGFCFVLAGQLLTHHPATEPIPRVAFDSWVDYSNQPQVWVEDLLSQ